MKKTSLWSLPTCPVLIKRMFEINLKEDMLEISAKSGKEKETEEEGYLRRERAYTRFYRAVRLPASVKEEGSTAKMENGVLTITLPKMKLEEPTKKIADRVIFPEQKDNSEYNV